MKKLLPLILALLLCGCAANNAPDASELPAESAAVIAQMDEPQTATVFAMDTVMDFTVYGGDDALMQALQTRIVQLESLFSVTDTESELYALNQSGTAMLSEDTRTLLASALELCEKTDGALDISIYPVVRAWGFTTGEYSIPAEELLSQLLAQVDYRRVRLEDGAASIPSEMKVDLGSVAKGYTGDVLADMLREAGVTSALLNLGGNVQTVGSKPDGASWRIAVQNPQGDGYVGVLSLNNQAAITSGGYERYFVGDDGETYWHIIDPETGAPSRSGIVSATIVGERGLVCDALSTALFVMGVDEAARYWQQNHDFETVLVTESGDIYITEGLETAFTLSDEWAAHSVTILRREEE